jgi:hypothetical protein
MVVTLNFIRYALRYTHDFDRRPGIYCEIVKYNFFDKN